MAAFAQWLIGFVRTAWVWLINHLVDLVQVTMDTLVDFLIYVVSLLPAGGNPPGATGDGGESWGVFMTTINWLFPLDFLVESVTWLCAGMLLYVVAAPLARWAKTLT